MGKQYFYGKIVSMFGNMMTEKNGMGNIMKYMMMSEMMKGGNSNQNSMLPMMFMMGGNMDNLFNFDFNTDTETEKEAK